MTWDSYSTFQASRSAGETGDEGVAGGGSAGADGSGGAAAASAGAGAAAAAAFAGSKGETRGRLGTENGSASAAWEVEEKYIESGKSSSPGGGLRLRDVGDFCGFRP